MRLKKALAVGVLLGGAALGGLFAYTKHYESQRYTAIAQAFKLTEAQTQVMRDCRASLARHERDFKDKVDPLRGCACVAVCACVLGPLTLVMKVYYSYAFYVYYTIYRNNRQTEFWFPKYPRSSE